MSTKRVLFATFLLAIALSTAVAQSGATGGRRTIVTYDVSVISNVRNSSVYVDGELYNQTTPVTLELQAGTYQFRVEARGYLPWQQRITIDGNRTLRVELLPPTATLILDIPDEFLNYDVRNPRALIDFYIDGRQEHDTRVEVDPGYHEIAVASGGLWLSGEWYFQAGSTYTVELILRMNLARAPSR